MPTNIGRGQLTLTDMNDVVASATAPSNPVDGMLWWNGTELKVYQNGQWQPSSNVLIGGRNIARITNWTNWSGTTVRSDYKLTITSTGTAGSGVSISATNLGLKPNTQYILSFKIKQNSGTLSRIGGHTDVAFGTQQFLKIDGASYNTPWATGVALASLSDGSYHYVEMSFKTPSTVTGSNLLYIQPNRGQTYVALVVDIIDLQVEEGNITTGWSPAPEDTGQTISDIQQTLGNMANDNILDIEERKVIKDKLTDIIGQVIVDTATALPTVASLDTSAKGSFYSYRKQALSAGITTSDTKYVGVETKYNALKTYLEGLTPIKPWDLRDNTINITVVKATFRDNWMQYYQSLEDLAEATAQKLKDNVDNIVVGQTNYASNGDFAFDITKSLWKDYYATGSQIKEVVDISTETPPHQFALHIKHTSNVNGGIWSVPLWTGNVAQSMLNKEITVSYWLKYQNIVQGSSSYMLGRFGEIVIEGETSAGAKVYTYQRVGTNNVFDANYTSGTNMTWGKYYATMSITYPTSAIKITNIYFKHALETCTGEFWTTGIKVEIGNKVTDWSLCPLDLQQKFTDVEFAIGSDQITSTVISNESYIQNINTKINSIIVGGRNYLLNSAFVRDLENWYPTEYMIDEYNSINDESLFDGESNIDIFFETIFEGEDFINNVTNTESEGLKKWVRMRGDASTKYKGIFQNINLDSSKNYIISFKAYKDSTVASSTIEVYANNVLVGSTLLTNNEQKIFYKFKPNATGNMPVEIRAKQGGTYIVYVTEIKLEEGTVNPTDWTSAPEDLYSELESLDLLIDKMSKVEQKITSDAITTTVTSSTLFGNLMNGYATQTDLGDLPNRDEVQNLIDKINIAGGVDSRLLELTEDEQSLLNKLYVTQTQLQNTATDITGKFTATGGMNLLKNSIGFADFDSENDWVYTFSGAGKIDRVQDDSLKTLGFISGFSFPPRSLDTDARRIRQIVPVVAGKAYTLSWYYLKPQTSGGEIKIQVFDGSDFTVDPALVTTTYNNTIVQDTYIDDKVTITPTGTTITISIYGSGLAEAVVTGLMLTIGDVALQWSLATGEVFNTNIRLDVRGIRVSQVSDGRTVGYTLISPDEFAGFYDDDGNGVFEKVFYLNGDETVTKRLKATEEITMGTLRVINMPTGSTHVGWGWIVVTE